MGSDSTLLKIWNVKKYLHSVRPSVFNSFNWIINWLFILKTKLYQNSCFRKLNNSNGIGFSLGNIFECTFRHFTITCSIWFVVEIYNINYALFSFSYFFLDKKGMPQDAYNIWFPHNYTFSTTVCLMQALFQELTMNATILTIVAFTIERYIAICHPFRFVCTRFVFKFLSLFSVLFLYIFLRSLRANFMIWQLCSVSISQNYNRMNSWEHEINLTATTKEMKNKSNGKKTQQQTNQVFFILVLIRWAN